MKNLLLLTILNLASLALLAQGTISGTILDEKYGDPLIGANVVVEGTSIGTSTDFDGKYQFNLEPGTYNIVYSYIGYNDKTITDVVMVDGEITYMDATLSDEALDLALGDEGVVVTAKAINRSENALMLLQKKSDKIQDGISSQEMSRYSVSDAAGAMKKVTGATVSGGKYIYIRGLGDRYSLTQLNGLTVPSADPYRNGAQLDLIPSYLLENIITSKTFTPDQPGNFTGGNVNLETKSFPEQFFLTVSASTSYNNQANLNNEFLTHSGGSNDYWGFDDGERAAPTFNEKETAALRFGPNMARIANNSIFYERLAEPTGLYSSHADYSRTVDGIANKFSTEFTPDQERQPLNHGLSLAFGNQYQIGNNSLGMIFSGSFKKSYQHLGGFQTANWQLDNINEQALENQGDYEETLSTETPTVNGMIGLAYKIGSTSTITANAIYNHTTDKTSRYVFGERPDNLRGDLRFEGRQLSFRERELTNFQLGGEHVLLGLNNAIIEWKGSQAISSQLEPDTRFFENDYNIDTDRFSIPASDVQRPFHFFRDLEDKQYDGKLDLTFPLANNANKIKIGGLFTRKERAFNESRFQVEASNLATTFTGNPDEYLADENYGLIGDNGTDIGVYPVNRSQLANSYTGSDEVQAVYGMLTYNFNEQFKFIGGARVETTNIEVTSADPNKEVGRIDETDILPSANLVYALTNDMNLRASYSQTVARPNMREISAFEAFDVLTKTIIKGNTGLKRSNITNYDLRWEWFTKPGEIIAISGYYKNFKNPIVQTYERAPNPTIRFVNVDEALVYGLELEFRKDLGELSSALRNFKFNANLSFINSESDVAIDEAFEGLAFTTRQFEGQSPLILNIALIYANPETGLDATLALNSLGDRLRIIGRDITPDIFDRGRNQLDFSISKKFGDLGLRFSAQNLLNDNFLISSTNNRLDGSGDGLDYTYSDFTTGVTFGLGVSYTIR